MDWPTIKDGLRAWFAVQSGVPAEHVHWQGEPVGMGAEATADLSIVSTRGFGVDDLVRVAAGVDGLQNEISTRGHRAVAVQFRVEARNGMAATDALAYCDRARDRLLLPSSQSALRTLGVGVNEVLQCKPLPSRNYDNRMQTVAVLEIRFNATASVTDEALQGTAAAAQVGGTITAGAEDIARPVTTYPMESSP